ncbi:ABC transporter ATP-binding protein [Saccharopolyspora gregorii]|uniref:ABC transporter ATP-binding protein n=1 Tax=Saccharopolyspora gregorii TaxID=33914 RepID=UPI0021ACB22C|nr:ABC transporter ATP-binding protein [Saccharopolyspora gregorii]
MSGTTRALPLAGAVEVRRTVAAYLRPHRGLSAAMVATAVLAALAGLVAPWAIGGLVDGVLAGTTPAEIVVRTAVVAVAGLLSAVLTAVSAALVAKLGQRVLARMREDTVSAALHLPSAVIERSGRGDLLSRVGDDVAVISQVVAALLAPWITALLTVALTMGGLFALDPWLMVAGMLALPVYGFSLRWYLPRAARRYSAERAAFADRAESLVSALEGLPTLRAYGAEAEHVGLVERSSDRARGLSRSVVWFSTRWGKWMNIAELVGLSAIVVAGFVLVDVGAATVGAVTAAALYFHRLFNPLSLLVASFDQVQSAFASLQRIVGVLGIPRERPAGAHDGAPAALVADRVTYRYPGSAEPVLHEVSLRIEPGETIALVGASGAGKSTLATLLAGLVEPDEGTVTFGGGPVAGTGAVLLVPQEAHVFSGPLIEDLRLARQDATEAEVRHALEVVGADWIEELPEGVHTAVGELGHPLGPDRVAQVALARALLADPAVVLLDEATAEASSREAGRLEDAAAAVLRDRAGLVVAHRLRQAAIADRVLVMDDGRVVESGAHDELLAAGGHYARLWEAWSTPRPEAKLALEG